MMALALLVELRHQGVMFIDNVEKLRVITPKGFVLSEQLKREIRRQKATILQRLRNGGIKTEDVLAVFPGATVVAADKKIIRDSGESIYHEKMTA